MIKYYNRHVLQTVKNCTDCKIGFLK